MKNALYGRYKPNTLYDIMFVGPGDKIELWESEHKLVDFRFENMSLGNVFHDYCSETQIPIDVMIERAGYMCEVNVMGIAAILGFDYVMTDWKGKVTHLYPGVSGINFSSEALQELATTYGDY